MVRLTRARSGLDGRCIFANRDNPMAVQQPQQASFIETGEGSLAVRADQIAQCPPEDCGLFRPSAVDEITDICNKLVPTPQWNVAGRAIRV
jgi:hypothetical protein